MAFSDIKRKGYHLQRGASNGAAITLVNCTGEFRAEFECATRCASILGDRSLTDLGDGMIDYIPCFRIPTEELCAAITKLSTRFSIALVEYTLTARGGQFVCLWRINSNAQQPQPASTNLDDY